MGNAGFYMLLIKDLATEAQRTQRNCEVGLIPFRVLGRDCGDGVRGWEGLKG
jgi:hypothetical protein